MVERPGPQLPPVAQAVLPHLRARGAGHIIQISTTSAVRAIPALGPYNAGKWGLEGFSQALAGEVARFGVRVSVAQLGGFGTDWAGAGMHFATPSAVYDDLRRELFGTAEVPWRAEGPLGGTSWDAIMRRSSRPAADCPRESPGPPEDTAGKRHAADRRNRVLRGSS